MKLIFVDEFIFYTSSMYEICLHCMSLAWFFIFHIEFRTMCLQSLSNLFPFLTTGLDHRSVHYVLTAHTLPGNACKRWNLFTPNIIDKTSWCVPSPIPKNMLQEVPTIRDFKISDSHFFVKNSVVPPKFMNSMRFFFSKKKRTQLISKRK